MTYRRLGLFLPVAAAVVALFVQSLGVSAEINPQPNDNSRNALNAPAPEPSAAFGTAPKTKTGVAFCGPAVGPGSDSSNVNTDCAQNTVGPHNESSIAIDPLDGTHMIGGMNDYQLTLNPDGHTAETIQSQAHVTFNGGQSWSNYPVFSNSSWSATGDPSVAFDNAGTVYYATLGFRFIGVKSAQNPDVVVSHSTDGGKSWDTVMVAAGSGNETGNGTLLDKEYIVAWGHGNVLVTYGNFQIGPKGFTQGSDVFFQVSHDGGNTWGSPQLLSGGLNHQAFVATPVIAADGSIYASFLNTTDTTTGRDDYEVQKIDPATGAALFTTPVKVATTIDGATDYPFDAEGRQTYQDSQFRTWAAGNIAADPKDAKHLAVVWSDMRNSTLPAPTDPYTAKTNSDVIVSQSTDGGLHWSATPVALALPGDQFMPWSAYDTKGLLRIGFFDRSYDPANHKYGYTLATEKASGTLSFNTTQVTTKLSDPTQGDRWFSGFTANSNFPHPSAFIGDYSNIAATGDGHVVAYWTDMRNDITFGVRGGHGEDAYFAAVQ